MSLIIFNKTYKEPPFCEKEILRYAGCKDAEREISALLDKAVTEVRDKLSYRACYCILDVTVREDACDFGVFRVKSEKLSANLKGCKRVILFAATVGVEIDRLIAKYGHIAPSRAVMLQAIGAERIEALCDTFCEDIETQMQIKLKPRFSPGYGDLPLETQREIFKVLGCSKQIGLSLNNSLLMSPSKSVTAFAGIKGAE